jgi:hypothetical protein
MKSTSRYHVVKYVPDVRRMEPRNIGVFVTHPGQVSAKFLSTEQARFVEDPKLYDRWVTFWLKIADTGQVRVGNKVVERSDAAFFDAISATGRGKYLLFDGGESLSPMTMREVPSFAHQLFGDLVRPFETDPEQDEMTAEALSFVSQCRVVFELAGFDFGKTGVHSGEKLPCKVGHATREFSVHYMLGSPRTPSAVAQRVDLTESKSVDSVSFMFEKLQKEQVIDRSRSIAFVRQLDKPCIDGAEEQLREFAEVIDVSNRSVASQRISRIARALSV